MYSDNNRRAAARRSNDAFLRRMLGGELSEAGLTRANIEPPTAPEGNRPGCDGTVSGHGSAGCPTEIGAPALSMVYAPRQCWRNVLEPRAGLQKGSIFAELILPFEGSCKKGETEVKTCR